MRNRTFGQAASMAARGGIFSALGVLLLLTAQVFDVLDLCVATAAAMLIWLLLIEYGKRFASIVFAVTALLAFLLTPANSGAIVYLLAIGWYPILKAVTEQKCKKRWISYMLKFLVFSFAFGAMIFLFFKVFVGEMDFYTLMEDFTLILDLESPYIKLIADTLHAEYLGINLIQWMMVAIYMLFAPFFVLLFDLLLSRMTRLYIVRLRPALLKMGVLPSEYK